MSDRYKGVVVVFQSDIKDEDAAPIIEAIKMIKGVLSVEPSVLDSSDWMNRERVRAEIRGSLIKALYEDGKQE